MSILFSDLDIETESDVEQKFIYKLLTLKTPNGFGYSDTDFKTKPDIRKFSIDKGTHQKLYYPDYIVAIDGIPSIIIEAKTPKADLIEASREGRLYATELNAKYPHKINPCDYVLITDGRDLLLTKWDSDIALIKCNVEDLDPTNPIFGELTEYLSKERISDHANNVLKKIRKNASYHKPVFMLGGKTVINQSVGENSFGTNVSIEYKYLFNPITPQQRKIVVNHAYVQSKRRKSHISPIDRIIRAAIPPSHLNARNIGDTREPYEIFEEIFCQNKIKNELCLLIGSVGSGKSTFMDHLKTIALPEELSNSTKWVTVNLNEAPLSKELIYNWVLTETIKIIHTENNKIDFDDLKTLREIYKIEIQKIEKGRASLFPKDSEKFNEIIYNELKDLQENNEITLKALIRYLFTKKEMLLILILDNCDKKNRDDQLLMFEVATWLKNSFSCSVFLPIRDYTYDLYSSQPPLDTVIKDLVFKIDPPLLQEVIYKRLKFAIREIDNNNEKFTYHLSNNIKVVCQRKEISVYLRSMIYSLFQDNFFRRIIVGLAGRNIRLGLEIFLEFCKSGHISEEHILKIRQSDGNYRIPSYIVYRALLKRKRLYYNDQHSYIKNLFESSAEDPLPDPFIRLYILLWLKEKYREYGPNNTKGYHQASILIKSLQMNGHAYSRIMYELDKLSESDCILSESLERKINEDDLISISPTGFIHLDLLRNTNYLSSVAEDTYFREPDIGRKIKDNMLGEGPHKIYSNESRISSSKLFIDYMADYHDKYYPDSNNILSTKNENGIMDSLQEYINRKIESNPDISKIEKLLEDYPPGTHTDGQITAIKNYGLFVEFGLEGIGLIYKNELNGLSSQYLPCFEIGDWVKIEILNYHKKHEKFSLRLIDYS